MEALVNRGRERERNASESVFSSTFAPVSCLSLLPTTSSCPPVLPPEMRRAIQHVSLSLSLPPMTRTLDPDWSITFQGWVLFYTNGNPLALLTVLINELQILH